MRSIEITSRERKDVAKQLSLWVKLMKMILVISLINWGFNL